MNEDKNNCKKCKNKIKRGEKAIMCYLCSGWFHSSCCNISDAEYASIMQLGSLVLWLCDSDKRKLKSIVLADNNFREETLFKEIKQLTNKMDEIGSKLDHTRPTATITYADVVNGSSTRPPVNIGMVVKPKGGTSSDETEKTIRNSLNLTKINTGVTKIKHVNNGGVYIGVSSGNDLKKLKNEAVSVLGAEYDVVIPKVRLPKVIIRGVSKEYDYKEFVSELIQTNHSLDDNDVIQVVHHKKVKYQSSTKWLYVLEVSGKTFAKIVDKYLNIDFKSQIVREHVDVLRCYKCQKYGHKSTNCSSQTVCGKCTGQHEFKNCSEAIIECVNCKFLNEKN